MPSRSKSAQMTTILERLEAAYGPLVPSDDPVEAGLMALLAEHAPDLSRVQTRQALREWVVDWNEMRVADPWDIAHAMAPGGHAGARAFSRAALRLLAAIHDATNRCSFERALADPEVDVDTMIDKMRGVAPHVRAVMKAALSESGDWKPDKDVSKAVQSLGLVPKTTSIPKVSKSLASICGADDRMRAHYHLTRYAHRAADAPDPLAGGGAGAVRKPSKKGAAKAGGGASGTASKSPSNNGTARPVKKPAGKSVKKPAATKSGKGVKR